MTEARPSSGPSSSTVVGLLESLRDALPAGLTGLSVRERVVRAAGSGRVEILEVGHRVCFLCLLVTRNYFKATYCVCVKISKEEGSVHNLLHTLQLQTLYDALCYRNPPPPPPPPHSS